MPEFPSESDLVVGTSSRILVTIKPDGTLIYGPGYTPDEAAELLWQALARRRAEAHGGELVYRQMETVLLAVGKADLENEAAQLHALETQGRGRQGAAAVLAAHRTNEALTQAVHAVIELGRGLALRERETAPERLPQGPSGGNTSN